MAISRRCFLQTPSNNHSNPDVCTNIMDMTLDAGSEGCALSFQYICTDAPLS